jgi:hypothetical protein
MLKCATNDVLHHLTSPHLTSPHLTSPHLTTVQSVDNMAGKGATLKTLSPDLVRQMFCNATLTLYDMVNCSCVCRRRRSYPPGNDSVLKTALFSPSADSARSQFPFLEMEFVLDVTARQDVTSQVSPRIVYDLGIRFGGLFISEFKLLDSSSVNPLLSNLQSFLSLFHPAFANRASPSTAAVSAAWSAFRSTSANDSRVFESLQQKHTCTSNWRQMSAFVPKVVVRTGCTVYREYSTPIRSEARLLDMTDLVTLGAIANILWVALSIATDDAPDHLRNRFHDERGQPV